MLLILGSLSDPHVAAVVEHLREQGTSFTSAYSADFPARSAITVSYTPNSYESLYYPPDSDAFRLDDFTAVWARRIPWVTLPEVLPDKDNRRFVEAESEAFLDGLWGFLSDRYWMNNRNRVKEADPKVFQLKIAKQVGFEIPQTLVSNRPDDVIKFFDAMDASVIYKPLTTFAVPPEDFRINAAFRSIYTTIISRDKLEEHLPAIALAPCLFQNYVPKSLELRVTVVGRELFAVAIHSQMSDKHE